MNDYLDYHPAALVLVTLTLWPALSAILILINWYLGGKRD